MKLFLSYVSICLMRRTEEDMRLVTCLVTYFGHEYIRWNFYEVIPKACAILLDMCIQCACMIYYLCISIVMSKKQLAFSALSYGLHIPHKIHMDCWVTQGWMKWFQHRSPSGVDRTTVPCSFAHQEESGDFYYQRPKLIACLWKLTPHDIHHGACMLATTEMANATKLAKQAFPGVSRQTVSWELKEHGLICWVCQSWPYISPANQIKWYAWAKQHQNWTLGMWKWIIFSDESKFLLFKSDGCQYAWFKPGQALDPRFIQKTIKHCVGNIMVWGCVTGQRAETIWVGVTCAVQQPSQLWFLAKC